MRIRYTTTLLACTLFGWVVATAMVGAELWQPWLFSADLRLPLIIGLALLFGGAVLAGVLAVRQRRRFGQTLRALTAATRAAAEGVQSSVAPGGYGELSTLAREFNHMIASLFQTRAELLATNTALDLKVRDRTADLELAIGKLEHLAAQQQALLQALRDVSTPVIPVLPGVLVAPLIGQFDAQRIRTTISVLLKRVDEERATCLLLDLTGMPLIDTMIARELIAFVQAARLLGADVRIIGVGPELAQTLVSLGVGPVDLHTSASLQSEVEGFIRHVYQRRAA